MTHTNDLTALALTHSALHNLAIPHIYSRFDIVWPDAHATSDPRTGVDALTYGLATLVMGEDVFKYCSAQNGFKAHGESSPCPTCGTASGSGSSHSGGASEPQNHAQRRLGNTYPQYTRKFSLGNGPADWVQEYMITKESGKMLGTLVALAVARMVNLETFVWDMPTGVLRDVWLALSSLQTRNPKNECNLSRVWVRWHDNSDPASSAANGTSAPPAVSVPGSNYTQVGVLVSGTGASASQGHSTILPSIQSHSQNRVEYPTLSVLPPLKSLSVLDIDELAYLDEMSILIARSQSILRELRIGIAAKAAFKDFVQAWDGPHLHQVDHDAPWPGASTIGEKRLGGVLGVLLGRVYDIRKKSKISVRLPKSATPAASSPPDGATQTPQATQPAVQTVPAADALSSDLTENSVPPLDGQSLLSPPETGTAPQPHNVTFAVQDEVDHVVPAPVTSNTHGSFTQRTAHNEDKRKVHVKDQPSESRDRLEGKLRLQTLELERVPLSVTVLQKGIDWSVLTSLTILDCAHHENLWKMLKRQFQPQVSPSSTLSTSTFLRNSISANSITKSLSHVPMEYQLNIKKIHTDAASPHLISFLKDTLAPNSLEVLFLQEKRRTITNPPVTIESIFKGPLKRHKGSLKKLLLDSGDKIPSRPTNSSEGGRWRNWMPNREIMTFLTSGRMSKLRELSIAIDYKDWVRVHPRVFHFHSLGAFVLTNRSISSSRDCRKYHS